MTASTAAKPVDRQARLRERIAVVEQAVEAAQADLDTAAGLHRAAEIELQERQEQLDQAKAAACRTASRLDSATSERDTAQANLATLRRQLAMATLVRTARS